MKSSTYYNFVKTKISTDFHIFIGVHNCTLAAFTQIIKRTSKGIVHQEIFERFFQ